MSEEQLTSDIVKDNAARVMKKIDTQIPLYVKMYSDLYREYMRIIEDTFEAGHTLELAKTNKLPQNQLSKDIVEYNIRTYSNAVLMGLDMYGEYLKWYSDIRLAGMKSLDQAIHNCMSMAGMPIKRSTSNTPKSKTSLDTKKQTRTRRGRRKSA